MDTKAQLLCSALSPFCFQLTLDASLIASNKTSDKNNLREEGFVLADCFRGQSVITGMAWIQRQLATLCPQSGCRGTCMLLLHHHFPLYSVQDLSPWDAAAPSQGMSSHLESSNLETPLQACPQFCLMGG